MKLFAIERLFKTIYVSFLDDYESQTRLTCAVRKYAIVSIDFVGAFKKMMLLPMPLTDILKTPGLHFD
jgi:hypothetical protein